jgi:hypothetical protein
LRDNVICPGRGYAPRRLHRSGNIENAPAIDRVGAWGAHVVRCIQQNFDQLRACQVRECLCQQRNCPTDLRCGITGPFQRHAVQCHIFAQSGQIAVLRRSRAITESGQGASSIDRTSDNNVRGTSGKNTCNQSGGISIPVVTCGNDNHYVLRSRI